MIDVVLAESKELPVLITEAGELLYEPTRWLLSLYHEGKEPKYVRQHAYRLKAWITFLLRQGVGPQEAVTNDFYEFRDELISKGNQNESVNLHLMTPLDFYWWAQDKGLYRRMVGWKDFERPNQDFQIIVNRPRKSSKGHFQNPFLLRTHQKPLPETLEVDRVKQLRIEISRRTRRAKGIKDPEALDTRNQLMISWFTEAALREEEVAQLPVSSIPERKHGNQAKMVPVPITKGTKFSKPRTVKVHARLIAETHDYIEMERQDLIDAHLDGSDPGTLFVSTDKGGKQPGQMIGGNIYKMFVGVGLGISPHDLRGYSLFHYAISLFRIERLLVQETGDKQRIDRAVIEMKLKQQAGHESLDTTLKNYINLAEVVTASKESLEAVEQEISHVEVYLALLRETRV